MCFTLIQLALKKYFNYSERAAFYLMHINHISSMSFPNDICLESCSIL